MILCLVAFYNGGVSELVIVSRLIIYSSKKPQESDVYGYEILIGTFLTGTTL